MKKLLFLVALGVSAYFLLVRKAGAVYIDSGGTDTGNPFYFSMGKIMGGAQTISQAGIDAIKRREQFSYRPYPDPPGSGKFSIGYGHQIRPGEAFTSLTESQADQILAADLGDAENAVNSHVAADLSQAQFDALCSFVYNVGEGAFKRGTVPEKLNAGMYDAAASTMRLYVKINGLPSRSLALRRDDEIAQFSV